MKVLSVASECAPFVKTGGLADVVSALPKALTAFGVDSRVLLPAYPALTSLVAGGKVVLSIDNLYGDAARLVSVTAEGLDLLLLDAPHLFNRPGNPYLGPGGVDWPDNYLRFGGLCQIGARVAREGVGQWRPDLVHAHDWQAGLLPTYLSMGMGADSAVPSVMTIHNIAFQGLFAPSVMPELGLPVSRFSTEGFEYYGKVGFLKAGLVDAGRITTVSPTYARELKTAEFGMGLEGLIMARRADLSGVLNGVELDVWNPETDPALPVNYTTRSLARRSQNKAALTAEFGLPDQDDAPLFSVVSRLTRQKGLDLLLDCLPRLFERGARLVVLGSGDADLEAGFKAAQARYPEHLGLRIGYDEALSHRIQGGADSIVIPSRFEPCGLTQLYGLRYGCLPLVARTGGLADTVIDANAAAIGAKVATGFQFAPVTEDALGDALARACDAYAAPAIWRMLMLNAMRTEVSWAASAAAYHDIYSSLLEEA